MDTNLEDRKRETFRNLLLKLSQEQGLLKDTAARARMYIELEDLYYIDSQTQFRHYYSDIFMVLAQIQNDSSFGSIDALCQNLDLIREGYQAKNKDKDDNVIDIGDSIRKLYDHVNLDCARLSYSEAKQRESSGEERLAEFQSRINAIENYIPKASETQAAIQDMRNKLENSQKEYIAILGIFSAVVLAFTAGIAFSTSVLENIHRSSIYRTVFVCCGIGLVLVNILFLMFRYVERIVHRRGEKVRWIHNLPVIIANAALLLVMLGTVSAWWFGFVEHRNDLVIQDEPSHRIESQTETMTE